MSKPAPKPATAQDQAKSLSKLQFYLANYQANCAAKLPKCDCDLCYEAQLVPPQVNVQVYQSHKAGIAAALQSRNDALALKYAELVKKSA